MRTYLVRHIATKEIQGIFWGSITEIWDTFDEIGDPYGFEYAPLKAGALFTVAPIGRGRAAQQYHEVIADDEGPRRFSWQGFTGSEVFLSALHGQASLRWKPFDSAFEGVGSVARAKRDAA